MIGSPKVRKIEEISEEESNIANSHSVSQNIV